MDNNTHSSCEPSFNGYTDEVDNINTILNMEEIGNGVLDMNVLVQLQQQIQLRTKGACMMILCIVAHLVNLLGVVDRTTNTPIMDIPQKERRRQELMSYLVHTQQCRDIIRMGPEAFIYLCQRLRETDFVRDGTRSTVEEQVAKILHIIGHNVKNKNVSFFSIDLVKLCLVTSIMY